MKAMKAVLRILQTEDHTGISDGGPNTMDIIALMTQKTPTTRIIASIATKWKGTNLLEDLKQS